jgi:hypothetical protein
MTTHSCGQRPFLSSLRGAGAALLAAFGLLAAAPAAHAVPSFARQTGAECSACHVGGYGPQLTPYGIKFKLGGYTDSDGKGGKVPLSAMLIGSVTHTAKAQAEAPTAYTKDNNNVTLDEASLFFAGRLSDKLGAFVQATYDGNERNTSLDQMDLRFAHSTELAGKETIFGLSLNNNPGVQDPFNTMPVWGFPYSASPLAFGQGGAASMINGGLEQRVAGLSAYTFWNNSLYAEVGTYRSLSPAMQTKLGLGTADDMGRLSKGSTYWRLAYFRDLKSQAFSAGLFGLNTAIQPDRSTPGSNRYDDVGVDASYQFLGTRKHVATLNTSYIHENQTRDQLVGAGGAEHRKGQLNEFKLNASYTYNQTWGFTAGRFASNGSSDSLLYGDGFANGSPNTSGYILQADWTPWGKEDSWAAPWANLRLGLQYTLYDKYNGAKSNYDGSGRDAKDNDTLYFFVWTSF